MKRSSIIAIIFLSFFALAMTSCSSSKSCSKKGKTKVPMGYM